MPWGDVTRTSGGFGCWTGDHSVCLFELWSSESSGSRTSADYGSTLILNPSVECPPHPLERKSCEVAYKALPGQWSDGVCLLFPWLDIDHHAHYEFAGSIER